MNTRLYMRHWPAAAACAAMLLALVGPPDSVRAEGKVELCDIEQLPPAVVEMRDAMLEAVGRADIEAMRIPIEMNEIPPAIGPADSGDPIAYWRGASGDGEGREVLAQIGLIMAMPCAKVTNPDGSALLLWPYLAALPLGELEPAQIVDLYRLVHGAAAETMRTGGAYTAWRIGIGENGVWHFMEKGTP